MKEVVVQPDEVGLPVKEVIVQPDEVGLPVKEVIVQPDEVGLPVEEVVVQPDEVGLPVKEVIVQPDEVGLPVKEVIVQPDEVGLPVEEKGHCIPCIEVGGYINWIYCNHQKSGLCPKGIFWTAPLFVTKLGVVVYHGQSRVCSETGVLMFHH